MRRSSPWALRLARNVVLWLPVAFVVWWLLTPAYNRFLTTAAENLLHLGERPDVTRLAMDGPHYAAVVRVDFPPVRAQVYRVRVTDIHFHLLLVGALFLAVPGVPVRQRLGRLGWALLVCVFFHLFDLVLWVKFVYSTQLGAWSLEHYGAFARNAWGLGKHLFDLPFKLALPLLLWAAFYLRHLPGRGAKGAR